MTQDEFEKVLHLKQTADMAVAEAAEKLANEMAECFNRLTDLGVKVRDSHENGIITISMDYDSELNCVWYDTKQDD